MNSYGVKLFKKELFFRWKNSLMIILGIAIGVSVALSLYIIEKSIDQDVKNRYSPDFFDAPIVLLSPGNLLDEKNIHKWLSPLSEKIRYSGYLNQSVWVKTDDGNTQISAIGIDFLSDIDEKNKKINLRFNEDELSFMNSKTAVAFSTQQLEKWNKQQSSTIEIITKNGIQQLNVEAEIEKGSKFSDAAVFYIATMQKITGLDNRFDGVFIWSTQNEPVEKIRLSLESILPKGIQVRILNERSTDYESLLSSFQNSIKYIRWLALFIAVLTIANSMSFSMNFRRKDIAILRCLGYNKKNIAVIIFLEIIFLGVIGSLLGIGLGIVISYYSMELVGALVSANYITVNPVINLNLGYIYVIVFFAGILAVILGTAMPITSALTRDPLLEIYPSDIRILSKKARLPILVIIELLFLLCIWIFPLPILIKGMASILLFYIILLSIFPYAIYVLQKFVSFIAKNKNLAMQVSIRNVNRNTWRVLLSALGLSASAAASLTVIILVSSFKYSVNDWLKGITADYMVTLGSHLTGPTLSTMDTEWIKKFEKIPGIKGALGFRQNITKIHNGTGNVVKIYRYEYDRYGKLYEKPRAKVGNINDCAKEMVLENKVMISESLVFKENIQINKPFYIETPKGEIKTTACAIVTDYGSENGVIVADKNFYKQYWDDSYVDFVELFITNDYKNDKNLTTKLNELAMPAGLYVTSNSVYHNNLENLLNSTFSLTYAALLVAVAVSFINLIITIWVFAIERRKEYAIVKALGATGRQCLQILAWEGFWVSLLGTFIGLSIGGVMSWFVLKYAIHAIQGWELLISIPFLTIGLGATLIPLIGFIVSYYPAKVVINELPIYQILSKE
jgi:putative ABC transport system permease protein